MKKQILHGVLLVSIFSVLPLCATQAEVIDRVVAIVNSDVITLSELNKEGEVFFKQIAEQAQPADKSAAVEEARRKVLSHLIDIKIASQKSKEIGISVSEAETEKAFAEVLERNRMTREGLVRELAAMGSNEAELRENLRKQILQAKLVNSEVTSKIVITEERIKEHYDKYYADKISAGGYNILQMGFSWGEKSTRSKDEARQQAEFIREKAMAGQSFAELAKTYSDLPSAADGGNLGVLRKDEMAPYMRDTIVGLQPGDISQIVETDSGYQFFKLLSVNEGELVVKTPYETVKDEIKELIYQQEIEKYYEKWVKSLREKAYIKELL